MRFIDTNVLIYAIGKTESAKIDIAKSILEAEDLALSVQVLQEFFVQVTRPTRPDSLSHRQASRLVMAFRRFRVQDITVAILQAAMETHRRFQISYWDAAILEAARSLGCSTVLTEDLNHGQDFDGVLVQNPFL